MLRELPFEAAEPQRRGRLALALLLRAAGRALEALAARLALAAPASPADPVLEFHAEAGAPEGALYVNGQLIGRLPGVTRL